MGTAHQVMRYTAASGTCDIDQLIDTLAPDAELVSPLLQHLVFRGESDLRLLLGTVYSSLSGLHWDAPIGGGPTVAVAGKATLGPVAIEDVTLFELAPDGHIQRIRPHLRPWLATTMLAVRLGVRLARHPGIFRRSWRR